VENAVFSTNPVHPADMAAVAAMRLHASNACKARFVQMERFYASSPAKPLNASGAEQRAEHPGHLREEPFTSRRQQNRHQARMDSLTASLAASPSIPIQGLIKTTGIMKQAEAVLKIHMSTRY
jgi:hypothetical protein